MNKKILFGLVILVILGFILIGMPSRNRDKNSLLYKNKRNVSSQLATHTSNNLKFSIVAPSNFQAEDTGITFILKSSEGEIIIIRNGTQYNDLESYLKNLDTNVSYNIQNATSMIINNLNAAGRVESTNNNKYKIYYIFAGNAVYNISTTSENLYDDLDQIAKSFRYTGE